MRVLCQRVERFLPELFTFVAEPLASADNNAAERSLRPPVVSRKISGGTRSGQGSETKSILASLFGHLAFGRAQSLPCSKFHPLPIPTRSTLNSYLFEGLLIQKQITVSDCATGRTGRPPSAQGPYFSGRSRQGAPVRSTHKMLLMIVRRSLPGRPDLGFCADNNGSSHCHCWSVKSPRPKRRTPPLFIRLSLTPLLEFANTP